MIVGSTLARVGRGLAVALLLLVGACAQKPGDLFVVLPDENGKVGSIVVGEGSNAKVLDSAYASSEADQAGQLKTGTLQPEEVDRRFGAALAARPVLPKRFTLYFVTDSDNLTDPSKRAFEDVFDDIKQRPSYEIEVVGHTDRVQSTEYNQKLSQQRADVVRNLLLARGIAASAIVTTGRGEFDPAVSTDDNVAEPRNRRVEILVR
jgi:outer membrane protein OmpA-like peptidoglycan-associated protein